MIQLPDEVAQWLVNTALVPARLADAPVRARARAPWRDPVALDAGVTSVVSGRCAPAVGTWLPVLGLSVPGSDRVVVRVPGDEGAIGVVVVPGAVVVGVVVGGVVDVGVVVVGDDGGGVVDDPGLVVVTGVAGVAVPG